MRQEGRARQLDSTGGGRRRCCPEGQVGVFEPIILDMGTSAQRTVRRAVAEFMNTIFTRNRSAVTGWGYYTEYKTWFYPFLRDLSNQLNMIMVTACIEFFVHYDCTV